MVVVAVNDDHVPQFLVDFLGQIEAAETASYYH